jgi:hypothetical protein
MALLTALLRRDREYRNIRRRSLHWPLLCIFFLKKDYNIELGGGNIGRKENGRSA